MQEPPDIDSADANLEDIEKYAVKAPDVTDDDLLLDEYLFRDEGDDDE